LGANAGNVVKPVMKDMIGVKTAKHAPPVTNHKQMYMIGLDANAGNVVKPVMKDMTGVKIVWNVLSVVKKEFMVTIGIRIVRYAQFVVKLGIKSMNGQIVNA
jgi:hypothetical protein